MIEQLELTDTDLVKFCVNDNASNMQVNMDNFCKKGKAKSFILILRPMIPFHLFFCRKESGRASILPSTCVITIHFNLPCGTALSRWKA